MLTADHQDVPFIEARTQSGGPAYTPGRPDGPPLWIVVHDMEFPERDDAAEWTANYFHTGAGGRSVSSHYTADNTSTVQCVRLRDVAWTVGNRPGNYRGINWELAGYASQTREQWLDPYGLAMLARVAMIMRRDMATFQIPACLLTDTQIAAKVKGVTSHWQLGRVFGGTDHTDPGTGFPWDHLITLLGGDAMTAAENWSYDPGDPKAPGAVRNQPFAPDFETNPTVAPRWALEQAWSYARAASARADNLLDRLLVIEAKLDQLLAQGGTGGATLDQVEELLRRQRTTFAPGPVA